MRLMPFAALALLAGCSIASDLIQIGPNRYQAELSFGPLGPDGPAKDVATRQCANRGQKLAQLSIVRATDYADNHATITFECQ